MRKLKVLVNAYACSPDMGSEPGMGWNWCVHLAKHCELHIITEGEFREKIEQALISLPQKENLNFYYNPVSEKIRAIAWNQGDWRFYAYYAKWQRKTLEMAYKIIEEQEIDIIHQLNMIGFREPGYLWKIEGIPFVWGPIGGLKQFPIAYLKGASLRMKLFNQLKNKLNTLQLKYDPRVNKALHRADLLISSIPDSHRALKMHKKMDSTLIPETGTFMTDHVPVDRFYNDDLKVMWVGKFDFRKQLPLALRSIAASKNPRIVLHIYGEGSQTQQREGSELAEDLKITHQVIWHGSQPNEIVQKAMREAQLFFFTSVSEDTSTVVLEALSNRLPVLCFDACGFGGVVDDTVGRKIPLSNPQKSIKDFAIYLNALESDRSLLEKLSSNCTSIQFKYSWVEKAKETVRLYNQIMMNDSSRQIATWNTQ